jgi:hypothetical protein
MKAVITEMSDLDQDCPAARACRMHASMASPSCELG